MLFGFITVKMYGSRETRTYILLLATAAGEVQATTSLDASAIEELRRVIERRVSQA